MAREKRIDVVRRLFQFWLGVMGKDPKRTILSPTRQRKIEGRLKDGYADPEGMIKEAILGCAGSDFHMARGRYHGQKRYNDIELICRSPEKLEAFAERHQEAQQRRAKRRADEQAMPWDQQEATPGDETRH